MNEVHTTNRAARRRAAADARHGLDGSKKRQAAAPISKPASPDLDGPSTDTRITSVAAEPEALVISHVFDSGDQGQPYSATARLTGRRIGVHGLRKPGDDFVQVEMIDGVTPGSGPVSITSWVYGLNPGDWSVNAEVLRPEDCGLAGRYSSAESVAPAEWSWRRWAPSAVSSSPVKTRWSLLAPLAKTPGVLPGSWPALGALAVLVALVTQALILAHENVPVDRSLVVFFITLTAGLAGAKLWYAILHPGPWRQAILGGWAVDGFLIVALIVAATTLVAFSLPVGTVLDAAAPGLFFGVAIGRLGCFLTGCCAGRMSRSRWAVWSSDRRVGARRIPAQLMESAVGLVLGSVAALLVLGHPGHMAGAVFIGAFALYVGARQGLLRIRAERRDFSWRRRAAGSAIGS